jgi:antitoxin YefM
MVIERSRKKIHRRWSEWLARHALANSRAAAGPAIAHLTLAPFVRSLTLAFTGHYPVHMKAITYTAAREGLASAMDQVCRDRAPVIITRNRDQAVVMMSLDDYQELEETAHLLRNPTNARRLLTAIQALESGRGKSRKVPLER